MSRILYLSIIILIGYVGWLQLYHEPVRKPEVARLPLRFYPNLANQLGQTTRIEVYLRNAKNLDLIRGDDQWTVQQLDHYPANLELLRRVSSGLAGLRPLEPRTDNPDLYRRQGVADPGTEIGAGRRVILRGRGNEVFTDLIIGDHDLDTTGNRDPDRLFVRRYGEAQSWLVQGRLDLPDEPIAWLDPKLASIPLEMLKEVRVRPQGGAVAYTLVSDPGRLPDETDPAPTPDAPSVTRWRLQLPSGQHHGEAEVIQPAATTLADFLAQNHPQSVQPSARAGDLGAVEMQVDYVRQDGLVITLLLYQPHLQRHLRIESRLDGELGPQEEVDELNRRWGPWLFTLDDDRLATLMTPAEALLQPAPESAPLPTSEAEAGPPPAPSTE